MRPLVRAWRIAAPKRAARWQRPTGDVVLSARDAAVIKKEIHQRTGESIRCGGAVGEGGREGGREGAPPPPLRHLCRMTSHFWNPAVYYKVLCTGTMTRAQAVTEATVITRKMVVPGVVASIDPRSRGRRGERCAAFVPLRRRRQAVLFEIIRNYAGKASRRSRHFYRA